MNLLISEIIKEIKENIERRQVVSPSLFILKGIYKVWALGYDESLTLELMEEIFEEFKEWIE